MEFLFPNGPVSAQNCTKKLETNLILPSCARTVNRGRLHDPYAPQCPSLYLPTKNCLIRALFSARV